MEHYIASEVVFWLVGFAPMIVGGLGGAFVASGLRHDGGGFVFDKSAALNRWKAVWGQPGENAQSGFVMIFVGLMFLSLALFDSSSRDERGPLTLLGITLLAAGVYTARALLAGWVRKRAARWLVLGVGVFLIVLNILPAYQLRGEYYYWSGESRVLLAFGVVLILVAVLTKPKSEPL